MSEGILPVRGDGRQSDELRPVSFVRGFLGHAEGSVLVSFGETKIVCSATVEDKVPPFLRGSGRGWVTAEYGMLPRSTSVRMQSSGQGAGLRQEHGNSATVGRSLRACVDMNALGENGHRRLRCN